MFNTNFFLYNYIFTFHTFKNVTKDLSLIILNNLITITCNEHYLKRENLLWGSNNRLCSQQGLELQTL